VPSELFVDAVDRTLAAGISIRTQTFRHVQL
jgi:hypothetical protein